MAGRAAERAWKSRLPLHDIRGIRLLVAAIYHAELLQNVEAIQRPAEDQALWAEREFDRQVSEETGTPKRFLERSLQLARMEAEVASWRRCLELLGASDAEIAAGEAATIMDFIFDPADLWRHKPLAMFIVERRSRYCWPDLGSDEPICRNRLLWPCDDLRALVEQYVSWHLKPEYMRPGLNLDFGRCVEHVHWRNYLAPYCEKPAGPGHPVGRRWHDGRAAAADYAWSLLHQASSDRRDLSVAEAVRISVAHFILLKPTDPPPDPQEAENYIIAASCDQAHKVVRKLLDEIIAREPPEAYAV